MDLAGLAHRSVHARLARAQASVSKGMAGQALVEFALTAPLFFFMLFFCLTAGFTTLERSATVNATTAGARIAAGAVRGGDLNTPALSEAESRVVELLTPSLLGTRVVARPPRVPCPAVGTLEEGVAVVCVTTPTNDTVRVEVTARPASFLPIGGGGLGSALDLFAVVHTATFKR